MKTWNRKCRQMRQLTIVSNPPLSLFKLKKLMLIKVCCIFWCLPFLLSGLSNDDLVHCPVNLSGNIFPLYDKYLSLIVVMKPKLKSWNYRQIVQWWLLVFWTESWKRYILLLDKSFLTLTSSYLCLRTGFSGCRDSASVYMDPELGKIHAC